MSQGGHKFIRPGEDIPNPPRGQSKRVVIKIVFLVAVARHHQLSNGVWLDGKIGFSGHRDHDVNRSSKNRAAGTIEIKPVTM
ncbi:unnamed protein product [Discosporangium mesarthrocarpum]